MGETVRAAGVRAVRQQRATTWAEVEAFLTEWKPDPFVVVVKPIQSAGSDDVFKCQSVAEVRAAFDKINGHLNGLGVVNEGALVQEFLAGDEYVIDSVSRDGVHKVSTINYPSLLFRWNTLPRFFAGNGGVEVRQTLCQRGQLRLLRHLPLSGGGCDRAAAHSLLGQGARRPGDR